MIECSCSICLGFIRLPGNMCCNCEKIFCRECIRHQNLMECPLCKSKEENDLFYGTGMALKEIPRIVRNLIKTIKFKCPNKCDQKNTKFAYDKYVEHVTQNCSMLRFKCPNKDCSIEEKNQSGIVKHYEQECDFT